MKKIRYKKSSEERRKQQLVFSLLIAFIMISSVLGYFGSRNANVYRYKGIRFSKLPNSEMYVTKIQGTSFRFHYLPQWLENISIDSKVIEKLRASQVIFTTYDFNSSFAPVTGEVEFYITEALNNLGKYVIPGFTAHTNTKRAVITCANATESLPVIYLLRSNSSGIMLNNSCIVFKAPTRVEFLAYKDRLLYGILGILP